MLRTRAWVAAHKELTHQAGLKAPRLTVIAPAVQLMRDIQADRFSPGEYACIAEGAPLDS